MSWLELSQILGNTGEFVGAILLVVSLIFVGLQLRQNTRAVQRSSAREAGNALVASLQAYVGSAELSEITIRAFESLESISPVDRYRFDGWMYGWLHAHELEHLLVSRESTYLDELLAPKRRAIAGYLLSPGGSQWWKERKTWFTDYFQRTVDDIVADPPPGFETSGHRQAL